MAAIGRLDNKVALITGASSGIGAGTAVLFSQLGASLVLTGRNEENLRKTAEQCLQDSKFKHVTIQADLTKEADVERLVSEAVAATGRLDILVNNAGIYEAGSIETTSLEQFDKIFNVNVRSVYHLTMLCVPHLIQSKGCIINVSSMNGLITFPNDLAYSMSKSALDQMTKCVALELASKQVRVNAVNPGVITTEIHTRGGLSPHDYKEFLERCKSTHPLGRAGDVEDVTRLIAFLASDSSSFITGNTVSVDGGRHVNFAR